MGSGLVHSAEEAAAAAASVGYPVLLKATGGGGGMGIFTCLSEAEVHANFATSQKQGLAFFGNADVSTVHKSLLSRLSGIQRPTDGIQYDSPSRH